MANHVEQQVRCAGGGGGAYTCLYGGDEVKRSVTGELNILVVRTDCSTAEALNTPFLLLPFRPLTDASGARSFIRNFYLSNSEGSGHYRGAGLQQELRLTEPIVLCSIMKWCWSRMPGGVVSWPVYEGFQLGEKESNMTRHAFDTFIPIGAGSEARKNIIVDFFDLLCVVAAHAKLNGLGGRKLSRLAGWWAFEHSDNDRGFEGGYESWSKAADASSHLFFAYLRSLSPEADKSMSVIERIPRSLQALLASTEYPPETPALLQRSTPRVVMLVDSVSPTPFALLRRAKHFEYRHNDRVLREFSEFEDPMDALTDECKRVLNAISSTNSSTPLSKHGESNTGQQSWSAFQDLGFSDLDEARLAQKAPHGATDNTRSVGQGLRSQPRSRNADHGRPTTPSWADFLSSGFTDDDIANATSTLSLPPDKVLPPLGSRAQTPLHVGDENLAPGELAAITNVDLDDAFWWVWMTSLAGEEPSERKAVFGRCALIETTIMKGQWLIMEEQLKGASPDPAEGAYIVPQKKSIFSFTKRGRNKRTKSDKLSPEPELLGRVTSPTPSKSSLAPDQHSKIKAAAAALKRSESDDGTESTMRRGRHDDSASVKTSSMLTLGMMSEATPALQWTKAYDKKAVRAQYLGDDFAGKGMSRENMSGASSVNLSANRTSSIAPAVPALSPQASIFPSDDPHNRELPPLPREEKAATKAEPSAPVRQSPPADESRARVPAVMPPSAPAANVQPADSKERQEEAVEAPLSEPSRSETTNAFDKELSVDAPTSPPVRVGRKPVPRPDNLETHPALRQRSSEEPPAATAPAPTVPAQPQSPHSPTNPAVLAAQRALEGHGPHSSPESVQNQPHAKLQKGIGGGGLKKLFGRKKDNPNRQSMDVPVRTDSKGLAPPADSTVGRRLSLMRKKSTNKGTPDVSQDAVSSPATEMIKEPVMPVSPSKFERSPAISPMDSKADANPDEEFSRFDQGPMEDMPAVTPQESDDDDLPAPEPQLQPQGHWNTQFASRIAPKRQETDKDAFVTPMERGDPVHDVDDAQSETTMEEEPKHEVEPVQDRWAQIRENAARRAARASEEQSTQSRPSHAQSTRETDDGETSGEESESEHTLFGDIHPLTFYSY